MTDERRAVCTREKCGHRQFLHTTVSDDGNGTYCGECGDYCGWPEFIVPAPFEETPSTDEGEARLSGLWFQYRMGLDGDLPRIRQEIEAAIRDPLEERIRDLESVGGATSAQRLALDFERDERRRVEAENERLREALRDTASHLNMESLVVDTALLPSPPSSTEGAE